MKVWHRCLKRENVCHKRINVTKSFCLFGFRIVCAVNNNNKPLSY